jgi:hypothetical protein
MLRWHRCIRWSRRMNRPESDCLGPMVEGRARCNCQQAVDFTRVSMVSEQVQLTRLAILLRKTLTIGRRVRRRSSKRPRSECRRNQSFHHRCRPRSQHLLPMLVGRSWWWTDTMPAPARMRKEESASSRKDK